jgi:hypothetical protein
MTISLEMSMKKLVRLTAHTLRGNVLQEAFGSGSVDGVMAKSRVSASALG